MYGPKAVQTLGEALSLWSTVPFAGMLLSIALGPLLAPGLWHAHFGKISAFWAALSVISLSVFFGQQAVAGFLQVIINEYLPFIILMGALYVISGGVLITGSSSGAPGANAVMLAAGTLLASVMGTTGAAMLLVRPLIKSNAHRQHRAMVMVFFIFLAANIGGAISPLGPPLVLGYLSGVPFFWTLRLLPHMLLAAGYLIAVYFFADTFFYRKEKKISEKNFSCSAAAAARPFRVRGVRNVVFLAGVVAVLALPGSARLGGFSFFGVHRTGWETARDIAVLMMAVLSFYLTPSWIHDENGFTWFPLKEVAVIFAGVFITMMPCLDILQAGKAGHLGPLLDVVSRPARYFWATGGLSSLLDNAPAYLAFFKAALGNFYAHMPAREAVGLLIKQHPSYLEAISAGSVFFGAFTYIGGAPNFMVRSISEESGVEMPGFIGYILKYALPVLLPLFALETLIFFR